MDNDKRVTWRDLTGAERLQVIEQAREGRVSQAELCRTFGMSRQVLHRAMKAADEAAAAALAPKPPGRKKAPAESEQVKSLERTLATKEKELARLQQKYEVMEALMDLQRRMDRGESLPGEKKRRRK